MLEISPSPRVLEIDLIKKSEKLPMTFMIFLRDLGEKDDRDMWIGAHMLNEMLDSGNATIISY